MTMRSADLRCPNGTVASRTDRFRFACRVWWFGDVLERTVVQSFEWRGMSLQGDGLVGVRSADGVSADDNIEWICGGG